MKRYDKIILIILLIIVLLSTLFFYILPKYQTHHGTLVATISQNGKVLEEINLDEVTETYTLKYDDGAGGTNTVEISKGTIRFIQSNCPDHLCEKHGYVLPNEAPAICLPHKLIIKVTDSSNQPSMDARS